MKILIVEDDFTSRKLLHKLLLPFGDADLAVNGREALNAFRVALEEGAPYALVCLDIMLPELDGQAVLKELRALEAQRGLTGLDGCKVIMTTALNDGKNIMQAFKSQCEGYLIKPIDRQKLLDQLQELGLAASLQSA